MSGSSPHGHIPNALGWAIAIALVILVLAIVVNSYR